MKKTIILNENLKKEIDTIKNKYQEKLTGIYLEGSHLSKTNDIDSDFDFLIILNEDIESFIYNDGSQNTQTLNDNLDYKTTTVRGFLKQIIKVNPNIVEVLQAEPLYNDDNFKPLAEYLYNKRNDIYKIDENRYLKSTLGMIKGHRKELLKQSNTSLGKKVAHSIKVHTEFTCKKRNLAKFVLGQDEKYVEEIKKIKKIDFNDEKNKNIYLRRLDNMIEDLSNICVENDVKYKEEFMKTTSKLLFDSLKKGN